MTIAISIQTSTSVVFAADSRLTTYGRAGFDTNGETIEQLSIGVMPIQGAMDFAYVLASTQVQMERFLPGEPLCGGPIDLMVWSQVLRSNMPTRA